MEKRELSVIRINFEYDINLLDELARETIIPFDGIFEYTGVKGKVEEIKFEPPVGPEGLALWVVDLIRRRLEYMYPSDYMLAVMPHPIMTTPEWGKGQTAFLSTYPDYFNIDDTETFVKYAKKTAAHELGHLFELEHHENEAYADDGYCLMYVKNIDNNMKTFLDSLAMGFCDTCHRKMQEIATRDNRYIHF